MSSRCFKLFSFLLRTAVPPDALPEIELKMQFFLLNRGVLYPEIGRSSQGSADALSILRSHATLPPGKA